MSFNPIYKMFTGDKHTKLPNDKKLNKQLDNECKLLAVFSILFQPCIIVS